MLIKMLFFSFLMGCVAQAKVGVEIDPVAYGLNGYSAHFLYDVGTVINVDLGVFAMKVPEFAESNQGFESSFSGYGIKLNYQGLESTGAFVGISYGSARFNIEQISSATYKDVDIQTLGVQVGYRFGSGNFYLKPWIGFDKLLNRPKVDFAGTEYNFPEVNIFPTVHIGYSF